MREVPLLIRTSRDGRPQRLGHSVPRTSEACVAIAGSLALLTILFSGRPAAGSPVAVASACDPRFADSTRLAVGFNPCRMRVADLDGDGHSDIVTANCSSQDISVLFGLGDGEFEPEQRFAIGARPGDIDVGDFDGDGYRDVVVECGELARLAVFWGEGGRSLSQPTNISCPPLPFRLSMADLDRDGRLDLTIFSESVVGVSVIWGDGTRDPAENTSFSLPFDPSGLATADFDGDGYVDLAATTCTDSTLYVIKNLGDRVFAPAQVGFVAHGLSLCMLAVGNLNRDQFPDVVAVHAGSPGSVAIGFGNGDGTFTLGGNPSAGTYLIDATIADFNGDGVGDIAATDVSHPYNVTLFRGNSYEDVGILRAGACPEVVDAVDLNGDTAPDLIVMNDCSGTVSTYLNAREMRQVAVQYDPSVYQIDTQGRALTARVSFPPATNLQVDPAQVDLVWRGLVLGRATSALLADSASRVVDITFSRDLLLALTPGDQTLAVLGCNSDGVTFNAEAILRVIRRRRDSQWQASLPGIFPILVRVPDHLTPTSVVRVYDSSGRLVYTQGVRVGSDNLVAWDGRSGSGHRVSSGVYVMVVEGGTIVSRCKVVVLR